MKLKVFTITLTRDALLTFLKSEIEKLLACPTLVLDSKLARQSNPISAKPTVCQLSFLIKD